MVWFIQRYSLPVVVFKITKEGEFTVTLLPILWWEPGGWNLNTQSTNPYQSLHIKFIKIMDHIPSGNNDERKIWKMWNVLIHHHDIHHQNSLVMILYIAPGEMKGDTSRDYRAVKMANEIHFVKSCPSIDVTCIYRLLSSWVMIHWNWKNNKAPRLPPPLPPLPLWVWENHHGYWWREEHPSCFLISPPTSCHTSLSYQSLIIWEYIYAD